MSINIMIADDHAVFRSGLKALLEKEKDFRIVAETGTGLDTIQAVDDHELDVLILDLNMPGMPGSRVAEVVLQKQPKLAIVVLTMHDDEYYMQELFKIGARAFVLKKSTGTDLVQAIRAVSRGEQYVDPSLAGNLISKYIGRKPEKPEGRLGVLSSREQEICQLLAYGHTNADIASRLKVSQRTVDSHWMKIMRKLDLKNRADLVRFAIDNGLLKLK